MSFTGLKHLLIKKLFPGYIWTFPTEKKVTSHLMTDPSKSYRMVWKTRSAQRQSFHFFLHQKMTKHTHLFRKN
jgi:hypothetical protein